MTRLRLAVLLCVCVLVPAAASADDGGFWDWLQGLSGPELRGFGSDVHLLCLDKDGNRVANCERWWGIPRLFRKQFGPLDYGDIKHELDFRFAFYYKVGSRFEDVVDGRALHAWKLMENYHYHFNRWVQYGGGIGYIIFGGEGFDGFSRGVLTPFSLEFSPSVLKGITLRVERSYITEGLNGQVFGNAQTAYSTSHEWIWSLAIGYDYRRAH
jgi:hypothetical protein